MLSRTYELRPDPPAPEPWGDYARRVASAWVELLARDPAEPDVQQFLETHPCLVPGAHEGLGGLKSGHAPYLSALVTQPALTGLGLRIPDFMWLASDSLFLNPVLIEIEAPGKPWITEKGVQHHKLTQGLQQLDEWRDWFAAPLNRQLFLEQFQIPRDLRQRRWKPIYVLIYGRQGTDARIRELRGRLCSGDRYVIPYEHIAPAAEAADYLCVRNRGGRFHAVSIPPTLQLSPMLAEDHAVILDKEQAAAKVNGITEERRQFLIERFAYWDRWARSGARGIVHLSDME